MDENANPAKRLVRATRRGIVRFPVPAAAALIAGVVLAETLSFRSEPHWFFAAMAGFFWACAAAIAWERKGLAALWPLAPAGLAALLAFSAGEAGNIFAGAFIALGGLFATLFALTGPLTRNREDGWNAALNALLTAAPAIAIAVLASVGLSAAATAIYLLFDGHGADRAVPTIWGLALGAAAPLIWFGQLGERDAAPASPGGVYRGLVLWLALPLAALCMLVLHGFAITVLPDFDLPDGGTAWVVAVLLLIAVLAHHASAGLTGGPALTAIQRWGPAAMIAPAALLILAAHERIDAHGLTELRIALIALGIWAVVMAAGGLLFRPLHGLRWQAASLALAAVVLSYGPFSAQSLAIADQKATHDRLAATPVSEALTSDEQRRLAGAAAFLRDRNVLSEAEWEAAIARSEYRLTEAIERNMRWCHAEFDDAPLAEPIDISGFGRMDPHIGFWIGRSYEPDTAGFSAERRDDGAIVFRDAEGDGGVMDFDAAVAAAARFCAGGETALLSAEIVPIADGRYGQFILRHLQLERESDDAPWRAETFIGALLRP